MASALELRDMQGYLRHLSVEAARRGDARDATLIMDELLAHVGAPSLAEPIARLRSMADGLARDGA
jgi:hypothetical protein